MKRKPMTFDLDRSPRTPTEVGGKGKAAMDRKQVGARIPTTLYRQLKARAGLEGALVQDLVEQAIRQFMTDSKIKS